MGTEPCGGGRSMEAIQAAVEVAAAFGVQVKEPVLLRSTNNTVVWFRADRDCCKGGVSHHGVLIDELREPALLPLYNRDPTIPGFPLIFSLVAGTSLEVFRRLC